jgi:hypothetical protein
LGECWREKAEAEDHVPHCNQTVKKRERSFYDFFELTGHSLATMLSFSLLGKQ